MRARERRDDTTGLILAGGFSRRFGTDKARFPIEGRTMIKRVYEVMAPLVDTVLVSVREQGQNLYVPAREVLDRFPGDGPLAGIHAGMLAADTPWLLVVAVDMPFLTRAVLEKLLVARSETQRPVVARSSDGNRQPLCACYPKSATPIVEEMLVSGRRAMYEFLTALGTLEEVTVPDESIRNVNYREDL